MTTHVEHDCFENTSGFLWKLPDKYKQWSTLNDYKNNFSYIKDRDLFQSVSEQRMFLDYQLSLFLWLKPHLIFEKLQFLSLCQNAGFIAEAMLQDLFSYKLRPTDEYTKRYISKLINNTTFGKLYDNLKPILDEKHKNYLNLLNDLRKSVHIKHTKNKAELAYNTYQSVDEKMISKVSRYDEQPRLITKELDTFIKEFSKYYQT